MMGSILCFGEVLLRLSAPGHALLLQQPRLEAHVGGAEANVAVALSALGHTVAMAGALPDNPLGHAARDALRRHGVDTRQLVFAPGRMGLYFHTRGAGHRPSEVLYDRAGSAFALMPSDACNWPALLAGRRLLHLSGITPALGENTAVAALAAARAAREAGVQVSFDGNFRARLWAAWGGDPRAILHGLFAEADIAFADHRDIALVLGVSFEAQADPVARFQSAAAAAFGAFPHLQRITATHRIATRVDHQQLGAMMATREGAFHLRAPVELGGIVERIGGGDAFAAGVLHGLLSGMADGDSLAFGLASGVLKHYLPGDASTLGAADIQAMVQGAHLDVRR